MKDPIRITTPFTEEKAKSLVAGDRVLISGKIYIGRDAAHKRIVECLDRGEAPPVDLRDQIIFYTGPCPAKPGMPVGPTGPTTAYRMDPYAPRVIKEMGLRGMLAKGGRSEEVVQAIKDHCAVYFICTAGIGALLSKTMTKYTVLAYPELGAEALAEVDVVDFPATVGIDCTGRNFYKECKEKYSRL